MNGFEIYNKILQQLNVTNIGHFQFSHQHSTIATGRSTHRLCYSIFSRWFLQPATKKTMIRSEVIHIIEFAWATIHLLRYSIWQSQCHGFLSSLIESNGAGISKLPAGKNFNLFQSNRLEESHSKYICVNMRTSELHTIFPTKSWHERHSHQNSEYNYRLA